MLIGLLVSICGCAPAGDSAKNTNSVVIWHWMTDREDTFNEFAAQYKELTGVDVEFELYAPTDAYNEKIKGAAQTNTLPDVFGVLADKSVIASFIKAGHLTNLTPYLNENKNEWRNTFYQTALNGNRFLEDNGFGVEAGYYAIPMDVMNIQFLYNKALFIKAGLDPNRPPKRWKEFLEVGNKLHAAGIQGMVSGWGEAWMIDCLASNYAYNIMGEQKIIDTIRGDVSYADPDWVEVFSLFKEMKDNNLYAEGVVIMVNKYAEQMFANERAAIAFNGSWCVNVYNGMNPDLEYGTMLPPAYTDAYPVMIWGGAGASFMVNDRSDKKDKAIDFLRWLSAKDQQVYLATQTKNLPANRYSLTDLPDMLKQFADDMDRVTDPNNLPVSEFSRVIEARTKGIQSIIIGDKTPEEVALEVQAVKVREIQKANR